MARTVDSSFNEVKSKYKAKDKHDDFKAALEQYGRLQGRKLQFNPINCSWADVFKELEKAEEAAIASEHGNEMFLTRSRRKLTTLSKSIVPILNALPDELYILHGGLAIVFHLAQSREKIRQDIIDTFEDIPVIIAMACSKSKSFPEDTALQKSIEDLKVTLFDAIPSLIEMLMPGKFRAKVTSLFQGSRVQDILSCIQRKGRVVDIFAKNLQDSLVVKNYLATETVQETTTTTKVQVEEVFESLSVMYPIVSGLDGRCQKIDSDIVELKKFISEQINDELASKDCMFQMLKNVLSVFLYDKQESEPRMDRSWTTYSQKSSPEQLRSLLNVPPEQELHDLDFVLRQSKAFDSSSKSYGTMVISSPQFQTWVAAHETSLIYVDGHLDSSRFGKTSPVSYFCANLVRLFRDSTAGITLPFFCGQHIASNDDLQGPKGLIRSLLSQLLQNWPVAYLQGVDLAGFNGDYKSISMKNLCQIFELLLRQIPIESTVFGIIDDLARFEKECWDEDYWHFLHMLGTLVINQNCGVRFKILITSSARSRRLQQQIPEYLRIELTKRD